MKNLKGTFHFSIDDVFCLLLDSSIHKINLKDHIITGELYKYYVNSGLITSLYCFREKKINNNNFDFFDLKFSKNRKIDWLNFGFHAKNFETPPYSMDVKLLKNEFDEFTNKIHKSSKLKNSEFIRLHYYSECFELKKIFKKYKLKGLFTTDKKMLSYRLKQKNKIDLKNIGFTTYNNLKFIRTFFRIENFSKNNLSKKELLKLLEKTFNDYEFLTIYVHEYDLYNKKTLEYLKVTLNILINELKIKPFN